MLDVDARANRRRQGRSLARYRKGMGMDEIPEDIEDATMQAAHRIAKALEPEADFARFHDIAECAAPIIARAILAERSRAATVADEEAERENRAAVWCSDSPGQRQQELQHLAAGRAAMR